MTVELAFRAAAVLVAASALCWGARSAAAAARHALWLSAVITTLALPLASSVSPSWALGAPASGWTQPVPTQAAERGDARGPASGPARLKLGPAPWVVAQASGIWLAGSGLVALYFLFGYLRLASLRRCGRPSPACWRAGSVRLSARARLPQPVEILVSAAISSPLVTGLRQPVVLIPADACRWNDARREAVLVHEIAHIRRRDLAAQLVGQALVVLHWFNPLAWHALQQMRRERELACDDEVLRAGVEPLAYASELLAIAIGAAVHPVPATALSMARAPELEDRLSALLSPRAGHHRRGATVLLSALIASIGVSVSGAHLTRPDSPGSFNAPAVRWTVLPGGHLDPFTPAETDGLSSADGRTREWATVQLGMTSGSEAVPALLRALTDPESGVREKAAVGLAWRRDDRIGPALVAAAADPSARVREKVLVALAFSSEPRAAAVLDAARADPDAGVREKANKLRILR